MGRKALFRLPLRLSCGPLWDFSDSLSRETVRKVQKSFAADSQARAQRARSTVSAPFVPPNAGAQGSSNDLSDSFSRYLGE